MDLTDLIPGKALVDAGLQILNKVIPDPEAREKAKLEFLKQEQDGQFQEVKLQMSAILAEAQSADKWTSRARPSFLYVVYILILAGLPMGVLYAFSPETATLIAQGFGEWLKSIPSEIIDLFKWVMLGYIGGRSFEKIKGAAK